MLRQLLLNIKIWLWGKFAPLLVSDSTQNTGSNGYFSVYLSGENNIRYFLKDFIMEDDVRSSRVKLVTVLGKKEKEVDLEKITTMKCNIVNHHNDDTLIYEGIVKFSIDYYLKIYTLKSMFSRMKGNLKFFFHSEKESISLERFHLLNMMVSEYVKVRPCYSSEGFDFNDIVSMIQGRMWHKSIHSEEYRVKLALILNSLVLSGDLDESQGCYFVQSKAINTLADAEKERNRVQSQTRLQKTLLFLLIILTALLAIIVIVLLALAGIIDLQSIWEKLLEIKPIRFLIKFL